MTMNAYIMTFKHAHFGEGMLNESHDNFSVNRLYSALFLEAMKLGRDEEFLDISNQDDFYLSDAFPYHEEIYLPKPIGFPKIERKASDLTALKASRREAKQAKKIHYIPISEFENYIRGQANIQEISEEQSQFTTHSVRMRKGEDPYEVGVTSYNVRLYVMANASPLMDELMTSLQYTGIGGKRSTGLGKFTLEIQPLDTAIQQRLNMKSTTHYMALSTSLPKDSEMDKVIEHSHYLLTKTSGYAYSSSSETLLRKQDYYKFKSGSTFESMYTGEIVDVRPDNFRHPVWNYSKGLFYGFNV